MKARLSGIGRAWGISVAAVALALAAGTLVDPKPRRDATFRGGYQVLEADFHAHTRLSDGFLSPLDIVLQAERRGLDVLAVTEHNMIFAGQLSRAWSRLTGGPTVLVGEEVTTDRFHVIAVGLQRSVDPNQSARSVLHDIHAQGGIAIAAHPVRRYWATYAPVLAELDAAEVMHPVAYSTRDSSRGFRWEEMRAFYDHALASGRRLTAIGSSDYHFFSPLGITRTLLFAEGSGEEAAMAALRAGRTVVYDLEGRAYGDPECVALLESEPYTLRAQDYDYRGDGILDRVMRTLGWLGALGVLAFRRRVDTKAREGAKAGG